MQKEVIKEVIVTVILFLVLTACSSEQSATEELSIPASLPPEPEEFPRQQPLESAIKETEKIETITGGSAEEIKDEQEVSPIEPAPVEVQKPLTFEERVWKKRIDAAMAPSYCPPVTKVDYHSSYYQGPLIDTHYHFPSLPVSLPGEEEGEAEIYKQYYGRNYVYEGNEEEYADDDDEYEGGIDEEPYLGKDIRISEIACTLQHEGTTRNFALFSIYPEIYPYALEMAKITMEQYPNLFTPFIDSPGDKDTTVEADVLSEMLAIYPGLFQGWGEIALYEQDEGLSNFPPDLPLFTEIYPIIRKHKMMVWMHPGENQKNSFERVLKQNPDINFIVHGDQIKDDIEYLMNKYPNIYFCVNNYYANQDIFLLPNGKKSPDGKKYFFAVFEDYESLIQKDLKAWKSLIEAHPDQVMWCLDREEEVLWTFDRDVGLKLVDYARAFIGRLDPAVQERFAYKNAERLINGD